MKMKQNARQLKNRHQPCPLCGGKDRYRYGPEGNFAQGRGEFMMGADGGEL